MDEGFFACTEVFGPAEGFEHRIDQFRTRPLLQISSYQIRLLQIAVDHTSTSLVSFDDMPGYRRRQSSGFVQHNAPGA